MEVHLEGGGGLGSRHLQFMFSQHDYIKSMFCHIWLMHRVFFKTGLKYEKRQKWSYYKELSIFNHLLRTRWGFGGFGNMKCCSEMHRSGFWNILSSGSGGENKLLFRRTDTFSVRGCRRLAAWFRNITRHIARCTCKNTCTHVQINKILLYLRISLLWGKKKSYVLMSRFLQHTQSQVYFIVCSSSILL